MKAFVSRLLVVFIFGVLPVFSGFVVIRQLLAHRENARYENIEKDLREQLAEVADSSSVESFYFALFSRLFSRFQSKGVGAGEQLAAGAKMAQKIWNPELAAYHFDEKGEYIALPGYSPPNRFIVGKIWDILAETDAYKPGDEQRQQKLIQTLLGSEANAGNLKKLEGQLVSLKKKRMSGYLYWNRLSTGSRSGILIIVFPLLQTQEILASMHTRAVSAGLRAIEENGFQFAFWAHDSINPLFSSVSGYNLQLLRGRMENGTHEFLVDGGRAWALLSAPGGIFLGSLPADAKNFVSANGMLNFLQAMAMFIFVWLAVSPRFNLQRIYMRIGSKLLAILLVAIILPTGGLLVIGTVAIDAHEKVLLSRLEKDQTTMLSALEDDFAQESVSFAECCRALKKQVLENYSFDGFVRDAQQMVNSGQAVRIELRSLDGERIHLAETGGWFAGLDKTQDAYGRHQIINTMKERAAKEKIEVKRRPDAVLTDAFSSDDFGFVQITRAPDKVLPFRFGQNELYWYWTRIEKPGHPAALMNIYQARNVARERFLRRVLNHLPEGNARLGVYDQNRRIWLQSASFDLPAVNRAMRSAILAGKPAMQKLTGKHTRQIALAFPGTVLAPFSLMLLTDERLISDRIETLYLFLALGIVLIIGVAFLIASLLSEAFLKPVLELDRGMVLVQKRCSDAHVVIESGDEFGELGLAFNQMVDDLNEMKLAKTVQDALFPQNKLGIAGYDTAVFNQTATDLGGDYCDHMQVGEHQYLFLIGDVSGHGTPAALCMALVKAAVFKACRDGFEFAALPGMISSLILRVMKRKKMMTMLFVLLDTSDDSISLINSGHNWPLIIRHDGLVEEIKLGGLPMGMRESKAKEVADRYVLRPGDILFSYTDALIECLNPVGDMLGHEAMYQELAKTAGLPPAKVVAHMESFWNAYQSGGVQQDDLTMMLIRKDSGEEAA